MGEDLGAIVDLLPGLVWTALQDGRVDFVNKRWCDYTGRAFDNACGDGWLGVIHPDDQAHALGGWRAMVASGVGSELEARLRRSDDVYRWFLFRAAPVTDHEGAVVRWCGINTDIEDRKQAEEFRARAEAAERRQADEALLDSERYARWFLDSIPGMTALMTPDGRIEAVNSKILDYFGRTREELERWGTTDAVHPDDLPAVYQTSMEAFASGQPYEVEHRIRGADGVYRWFMSTGLPLHDSDGRVVRYCSLMMNIEARKEAEDALRAREHDLDLIINTLPTTAWATDPNGLVEFLSDRWLNYAGFTAEQGAGLGWGEAIHPDDAPGLFAYWQGCLESGKPVDTEARMRRFDGEYRWFLFRANPLRDENGAIIKWYGTNIDIEDRKRVEAQLAGEKQLLGMVAEGRPLVEVLETLCQLVEATAGNSLCSILTIDPDGLRFRNGAGPSLPSAYNEVLDGLVMDRDYGPCGLAAKSKTQAIAADVATDPRWKASSWPKLALSHGLQSCWSTPILTRDNRVIGVFALYQDAPAAPTPLDEDLIRQFAHIASIAIERAQSDAELKRIDDALRRSNAYLEEAQRLSLTGSFITDGLADEHDWSDEMVRIFGFPPNATITNRMIMERIHPDDLVRVETATAGAIDGGDFDMEYRLLLPSGAVKYLHAVGHYMRSETDHPVVIGCVRDITERKSAEQELLRINGHLEEAQRLSLTGSFTLDVAADDTFWSDETYRIFAFDPAVKVRLEMVLDRIHPDDVAAVRGVLAKTLAGGKFDVEWRLLMPDGAVKPVHVVGRRTEADPPVFVGSIQDITERKRVDAALRRTNGYLEEAQRLSLTGSFTWDVPTDEHTWSGETFRIFEIEPAENVGLAQIQERVHPDDLELVGRVIGGAADGADFELEMRLLMPSGAIKQVYVVGHRIEQITDRPVFLGCIQDITERKLAESKLRQNEAMLAEGQRLSATGSFSWPLDTDDVLFSDELNRIFEFEPGGAVTLEAIAARVHSEDLSLLAEQMASARAGIEDHRYEIRLRMPSGLVKHVFVVGHRVAEGADRPVFIGAVRDITESKKVEHEMRRTTEHLLEAEALSKTGSASFHYASDEHHWSDELCRIWGYEAGTKITLEMVGARVHPEDKYVFQEFGARVVGRKDLQFRLQMPDGEVKYIRAVSNVFRAAPGAPPEGVAALQDVTQQWHNEQALGEVRAQLAHMARVTALGALTASIAHEVNQPLSGIITNASTCLKMLGADPPNVAGAQETARRTVRDGNRAADVIKRLRALFARKAAAREVVDLNEAVRELLALSWGDLQRRRIIVRSDLADDLPTVTGDRVQLQQVILNLLLNAAEAMSEVEGRPRELWITTRREGSGQASLAVKDVGVGLASEAAERLFEAFYTTKDEGMGIGLSVSRSIIESHGGKLWGAPNEGPGATFAFSVPTQGVITSPAESDRFGGTTQ